ncbi:piggyBac transposable element-derived protein 2-like isoform X2 [Cheilinus undulatus]|uniref:piggyBac transposable element-derived protein 2-like isoform X2 n=1 Tax=Cheilinus undulatus TaxID=241271 RepID=UPI001BD34232|nr:piggyBac transposable element-derived protein 2-like isoform X2 [Cheilinus undulatus]
MGIANCCTSYGRSNRHTTVALVPADPCESEGEDISEPEEEDDADWVPPCDKNAPPPPKKQRTKSRLTDSIQHSDFEEGDDADWVGPCDENVPPLPKKKQRTKSRLIEVPSNSILNPSPPSATKKQRNWAKKDIPMFTVPEPVFSVPESVQEPLEYFKRLFSDQMIEHISEHTNLYSVQQTGASVNTTAAEIEDFLSVLLYMGVFPFPAIGDYWAAESRFPPVADTMSVKRFQVLRRYVHFSDNFQTEGSTDRYTKIRPLFDMFRQQCLLIPATNRQSVDKVMVAYKGSRAGNLLQNKLDKWGFKIFCRGSSSGIIHDFILYQGATTFCNIQEEEVAHLGLEDLHLGAKVVSILCNTIANKEATVVFYDDFFTSHTLVKMLHTNLGIRSVGTARENLTGGAILLSDKELEKQERGAVDFCSSSGVIAVKWYGSKCVTLLSNACGVEPLSSVKRFSKDAQQKVGVPCPSIVLAYNQAMGGIDLSDMLVNLYKTSTKSRRWYMPLFGYIIDLSIANAWLIYKRDCDLLKEKPMPLKKFRLSVAAALTKANKVPARAGWPPSAQHKQHIRRLNPRCLHPTMQVRYDGIGHWPSVGRQRGRCNFCKGGVSRWRCSKCGDGKLFLCLNSKKQCFVAYHQK